MALLKWSERSLSFWVTLSIALSVLPLAVSTVMVHVLFSRGVIAAYDDVAIRYRDHIGPTSRLEVAVWKAADQVDKYGETRDDAWRAAYATSHTSIEASFVALGVSLGTDTPEGKALAQAHQRWTRADAVASQHLLGPAAASNDDESEFDRAVDASARELQALQATLTTDLSADHLAAITAYERSNWISAVAAGLSVLALIGGVALISRIMLANVDRLVSGARKFAEGDRSHFIDVKVPAELRDVAKEFNRMIGRIRETEAVLAEEARRDPLTGLPNRRTFEGALREAFARLERLAEPFVLVMLDVDHFKRVNDTHGHAAGDDVLRAIAGTLSSTIRAIDRAFRVGGEEFALLLTATDARGALIGAERLRQAIAAKIISTEGVDVTVTVSIGIAQATATSTADDLCRAADRALYQAKEAGRDRIVAASQSLPDPAATEGAEDTR